MKNENESENENVHDKLINSKWKWTVEKKMIN